MAAGRKTGGRKKGTPNKVTADVKRAILDAFETAGAADYLAKVASEDPRTFCALLGKVLPLQVSGDPDNPIKHRITVEFVDSASADS